MKNSVVASILIMILGSCGVTKKITRIANEELLKNAALKTAHLGISIFDSSGRSFIYEFQGEKYFVPASNTKIPTCYAAMKYLGDSLTGLIVKEYSDDIILIGAADPSFLHPDFPRHPVFEYLLKLNKNKRAWLEPSSIKAKPWGSGWGWSDFEASYMPERSQWPIYGNVITFSGRSDSIRIQPANFYHTVVDYRTTAGKYVSDISRQFHQNEFVITANGDFNRAITIPYITSDTLLNRLLKDTLKLSEMLMGGGLSGKIAEIPKVYKIRSQPTDSLLRPMMHRSDNFFAEQSLLMVSNELLGEMSETRIIDTLLKTDFKDLPQRPRWADGSGLSRYNLFSPRDFVTILHKMEKEFGMERIKGIFPTGGEGTISNYYQADSGYIYGKTGTLSGVVAFSGYLYTKKGKLLIFSTLVNNHQASATEVRRAIEKFLKRIRENY